MYRSLKANIPNLSFSQEASMRVAFMMALVALFPGLYTPAPQASEEEAIKAVLRAQVKAFRARDADAWQALWVHDAAVTRTIVANGLYVSQTGWDKVSAQLIQEMKADPTPIPGEPKMENFVFRRDGNVAWVFWDQHSTPPQDPTAKNVAREHRVLLKDGGQWKIASQITHAASSFEGPENSLNGAGYALLADKKPQEAIEVFKINVRLYPQSWNAYDSLGEAYAEAGQKDLAIKNYEKSVELNPKNTSGLEALKKLRQH